MDIFLSEAGQLFIHDIAKLLDANTNLQAFLLAASKPPNSLLLVFQSCYILRVFFLDAF